MRFKVGDKVRCIKGICPGNEGYIINIIKSAITLDNKSYEVYDVEFDRKFISGHSGNGTIYGKHKHVWGFYIGGGENSDINNLILIDDFEESNMEDWYEF